VLIGLVQCLLCCVSSSKLHVQSEAIIDTNSSSDSLALIEDTRRKCCQETREVALPPHSAAIATAPAVVLSSVDLSERPVAAAVPWQASLIFSPCKSARAIFLARTGEQKRVDYCLCCRAFPPCGRWPVTPLSSSLLLSRLPRMPAGPTVLLPFRSPRLPPFPFLSLSLARALCRHRFFFKKLFPLT